MKQFKGTKSVEEIIKIAEENQWEVDSKGYESWSDYIYLRDLKDEMLTIQYNTFNGHFAVYSSMSEDGKPIATHTSENLDHQEWYNEILDMFYETVNKQEVI
jgi:hypothetical protein